MDAQHVSIAQDCLNAAYEKTMSFPDIVATLIQSGFEGYVVDYRRNTTTYFMPDGDNVMLENPPSEETVAPSFDQPGIVAHIKWAQSNLPIIPMPRSART